jgi:hypothetical protein
MKSITWLASHDLSLTFDPSGRLWTFRGNRVADAPEIGAVATGEDLVVTVTEAGVRPGDFEIDLTDDVLVIHRAGTTTDAGAFTVGLPMHPEMHALETTYCDDAFVIKVPLTPAVAAVTAEDTAFETAAVC